MSKANSANKAAASVVPSRTSKVWVESDPATVKAADQWFEQLHPLVDLYLILRDIKAGVKPESRNILLVATQEDEALPFGLRLGDFSIKDNPLTRLEFEKSPRLSRGSGNELIRIGLQWKPKTAKTEDEIACRNVRLSCSNALSERQLTVDVPGYPMFEQRRWSAYHGFVKYHPDQLIYNVASDPPTLTAEFLGAAAFSCVDTVKATIEMLQHLTSKLKGQDKTVDQISELSFLNHM